MKITFEVNGQDELDSLVERFQAPFHDKAIVQVEAGILRAKTYDQEETISVLRGEVHRLEATQPPPFPMGAKLRDLGEYHRTGNKIGCIKLIREMAGLGLKESKDLYEEGFCGATPVKT
jgi:ribosomal protein L7/L12